MTLPSEHLDNVTDEITMGLLKHKSFCHVWIDLWILYCGENHCDEGEIIVFGKYIYKSYK